MAAATDQVDQLDNYHQFIIIGGGIAGLSAASHLAKNGFKDFRHTDTERQDVSAENILVESLLKELEHI